jgi:hypothetical protein
MPRDLTPRQLKFAYLVATGKEPIVGWHAIWQAFEKIPG